jgi:hypothetical protein
MGPGTASASNSNDHHEIWGVTTLPSSVRRMSRECQILDISQLYRPPRAVSVTALLTFFLFLFSVPFRRWFISIHERKCHISFLFFFFIPEIADIFRCQQLGVSSRFQFRQIVLFIMNFTGHLFCILYIPERIVLRYIEDTQVNTNVQIFQTWRCGC